MKRNVILTDVDGCLLDWEYSFDTWMQQHGYIKEVNGNSKYSIGKRYNISNQTAMNLVREFNQSSNIGNLNSFKDAQYYVKLLNKQHGFVFHCITSLTKNQHACELREKNLISIFGEHIFEKFIFLDTDADKGEALAPYKDSNYFWIEDKIVNCQAGQKLGLRSILVEHEHNVDFISNVIPRLKTWKDIYFYILNSMN